MSARLPKGILRIRIPHGDLFAMGPGKADLLEAIDRTHSIAAAGREVGLSYWKTRALMDEMAQCFRAPVVEAARGGTGGGGAQLTDLGRTALERFRAMEARAEQAIASDLRAYRKLLGSQE